MNFEIPKTPDQQVNDYIIHETRKYNSSFVPNDFQPLAVYCRNEDNNIVGGLTGKTYWNYLEIEFLWVHEQVRDKGVGSRVITLAEDEAKLRKCDYAMLDTYDFQALEFYLKQGYTVFGQLDNYCSKYSRHYLKKNL